MNVQSNLVQSNLRRKSKWLCNLNTNTEHADHKWWSAFMNIFLIGMGKYPNCSSPSKCLPFLYLRNRVFALNAIADVLIICRRYRLVLSVTWTTQILPYPNPSGAICVRMMETNEFWQSNVLQLVWVGWCIGSIGSGRALYFLLGFQYKAVIQIVIFSIIKNRLQSITNVIYFGISK